MLVLYFVLYLLALVCFAASAFNVVSPRVNLLAAGLLFGFAVPCIQTLHRM